MQKNKKNSFGRAGIELMYTRGMCVKERTVKYQTIFFPFVLLSWQWSKVISESRIDLVWTTDGLTESRAHRPMANSSFLWTSQDKIMRSLSGD